MLALNLTNAQSSSLQRSRRNFANLICHADRGRGTVPPTWSGLSWRNDAVGNTPSEHLVYRLCTFREKKKKDSFFRQLWSLDDMMEAFHVFIIRLRLQPADRYCFGAQQMWILPWFYLSVGPTPRWSNVLQVISTSKLVSRWTVASTSLRKIAP